MNTMKIKSLDCGHGVDIYKGMWGTLVVDGGVEVTLCYDCCAEQDRAEMRRLGIRQLYIETTEVNTNGHHTGLVNKYEVTNWPGSLRYPVLRFTIGDHNMAGRNGRLDVWFNGPDGHVWHGVNIGDNQLTRCKRTKEKYRL